MSGNQTPSSKISSARQSVKFSPPQVTAEVTSSTADKDAEINVSSDGKLNFRQRRNSRYSISKAFHLKQRFGLYSCVRMVIAVTIGSGIFTSPTQVVKAVSNDSISLCIWFAYGVINFFGALCYIELGTTFPVSSGNYAYLNECFGSLFGFLYQWSSNLIFVPMVNAVMALVIGKYFVKPYFSGHEEEAKVCIMLVGLATIMFICYVVSVHPNTTLKLQKIIFYLKLISIGAIVFCGIFNFAKFGLYRHTHFDFKENPAYNEHSHKTSAGEEDHHKASHTVDALYQASYSYLGFYYLNFIVEEIRSPLKTLPLALYISVPTVMIIYLLVNFCYFVSLSPTVIGHADIIATDMLDTVLPEGASFYTRWILPFLIACGCMGTLSVHIGACARIAFVGARNGHVPQLLALIQVESHTPTIAIVFTGILACFFMLTVDFDYLISIASHVELAFIMLTVYALIYMRFKKPDLLRPIKFPIVFHLIYAVVSTLLFFTPFLNIVLDYSTAGHAHFETAFYESLKSMAGALFVVITGLPVYYFFVKRKPPRIAARINKAVIILAQKIIVSLPEMRQLKSD